MINIRVAESRDIISIKKLVDENISVDYFSEAKIASFIDIDNNIIYIAEENDEVVAFIYCKIDSLKNAKEEAFIACDSILNNYDDDTKVLLYKTTCTSGKYRNEGILSSFIKKIDEISEGKEFEFSFVLALVYPDGAIPVHKILCSDGFEKKDLIIKPWNKLKSYCNYCGNEYCTCNGMLYIKEKRIEKN